MTTATEPKRRGRPPSPGPDQIRAMRIQAGHSQTEAAELVHTGRRTWANWEQPAESAEHRPMPLAAWELYRIKAGGHETFGPK